MNSIPTAPALKNHLSFKGNLKTTRYGWLRLTPAYSVHLVNHILDAANLKPAERVLDPFCGTGTTALVCATRGLDCVSTDINPFLVWLARAKTSSCSSDEIKRFENAVLPALEILLDTSAPASWTPPLHQIEKWWDVQTLAALGRLAAWISEQTRDLKVQKLLQIAFCRICIEASNASFGHQSMSFKKANHANGTLSLWDEKPLQNLAAHFQKAVCDIAHSAASPIVCTPQIDLADSRHLAAHYPHSHFDCVITSPPYPNRMSYIRELRPYMYWLGFLQNGRDAGEMDWLAIGGTWGCATSNLNTWVPDPKRPIPFADFLTVLNGITQTSPLLARYVHKYFEDISQHIESLKIVLKSGASMHYIVGNSKFYDVMLPVEEIYAALFKSQGFENVQIETIRKRTSKKELWEFVVSARKT